MEVEFRRVDWPFTTPFRISYQVRAAAETVWVCLKDGNLTGRGEALGVSYHGETADQLLIQLRSVHKALTGGVRREQLDSLLPAGGARNALDCALWDLEAKRAGRRAWELAGIAA